MQVQVMLPSYLRADFDKYFGQDAGSSSAACKPAQPTQPTAPPAEAISAGAHSMAAAQIAEPDDGAAAAGSRWAGAGDTDSVTNGCGTPKPVPASPLPNALVQDHSHQVLQPAQEPDSPPGPGRAAVALDFMDTDGAQTQQAAGDAGTAAFDANDTEQPTAARQQEAAVPVIDLVFDDASGTAQQAVDTDGAAQRIPGPTAALASAQATDRASVPAGVPILAAAAAAWSQELDRPVPGAAPLPPRSAPVMPVFRSRVSRMQLPNQPALEDEEGPEHSNSEMASGVHLLPSDNILCWQHYQWCAAAHSSSIHCTQQ